MSCTLWFKMCSAIEMWTHVHSRGDCLGSIRQEIVPLGFCFFSCMCDMSAPMCAAVMQFDLFLMYFGLHKSANAPLCDACVHSSSNAITVVLIGLRHPMPRCIIGLNSRVICARGFGPLSSLQPLLTLAAVL